MQEVGAYVHSDGVSPFTDCLEEEAETEKSWNGNCDTFAYALLKAPCETVPRKGT